MDSFFGQGIRSDLPDPLKKRVRITNAGSLFGAIAMLATIPIDRIEAPRWMLAVDVFGALAFVSILLLNRRGHLTASRIGFVAMATLLALSNAIGLGPDSGVDMLFISLVAVPFAVFDLAERGPLVLGVLLPIAGFILDDSGALDRFHSFTASYSAPAYRLYSTILALTIILYSLYQMSRANARAERALRLDIAERQRAERALHETRQASITSAKMAALGEMSANVAHEVNNPLAAILLRAQRLELLAAKDRLDVPAVLKSAREIDATVDRIRRIVDALRFFARQADDDPLRPESVLDIANNTVELCAQRFLHEGIDLRIDPIAEELYVECRGAQISQVLLNLLSNAHDAVERGPVRRVGIAVEADDEEVRIAVTDSGPGIPPELESRIMEPFFTTKEIGKGTGLGLAVSKGIAETHGGQLTHDLASAETRFVLTLRRCPPPEPDGFQVGSREAHR